LPESGRSNCNIGLKKSDSSSSRFHPCTANSREADCLIGILNMEENKPGDPTVEVFDSNGFVTSRRLGTLPGLGCRHFLLSDFLPDLSVKGAGPLTLRLTDVRCGGDHVCDAH